MAIAPGLCYSKRHSAHPHILHALGFHTSPKRQRGPQPIPSLALRASVLPPANVAILAAWSTTLITWQWETRNMRTRFVGVMIPGALAVATLLGVSGGTARAQERLKNMPGYSRF